MVIKIFKSRPYNIGGPFNYKALLLNFYKVSLKKASLFKVLLKVGYK